MILIIWAALCWYERMPFSWAGPPLLPFAWRGSPPGSVPSHLYALGEATTSYQRSAAHPIRCRHEKVKSRVKPPRHQCYRCTLASFGRRFSRAKSSTLECQWADSNHRLYPLRSRSDRTSLRRYQARRSLRAAARRVPRSAFTFLGNEFCAYSRILSGSTGARSHGPTMRSVPRNKAVPPLSPEKHRGSASTSILLASRLLACSAEL